VDINSTVLLTVTRPQYFHAEIDAVACEMPAKEDTLDPQSTNAISRSDAGKWVSAFSDGPFN
jgi:hypothetical protein